MDQHEHCTFSLPEINGSIGARDEIIEISPETTCWPHFSVKHDTINGNRVEKQPNLDAAIETTMQCCILFSD